MFNSLKLQREKISWKKEINTFRDSYCLQFVSKLLSPLRWRPKHMVKLITSMSLLAERAIKTLSLTGTFSKLNFFSLSHLLKSSLRLSVDMWAILKSKYISLDLKVGEKALESGSIGLYMIYKTNN